MFVVVQRFGLGLSPLAGHTWVQYLGSLTGRDFWAIAQATLFVVYNLVSKDCMETWVALLKLIPLIWQPKIHDIEAHIVSTVQATVYRSFNSFPFNRNC
jgi:hypothetical protein